VHAGSGWVFNRFIAYRDKKVVGVRFSCAASLIDVMSDIGEVVVVARINHKVQWATQSL
jgi:hypothetical protein